MKVSVAVATYNGENFIEEQLVSIGEQGYQPSEIVICDDGSSDDTLFICEKFSRKSSFPCLIFRNEKRLGFADNFLRAASLCSGDLIAFCDQDDVWTKDKLARCVAWFQRSSEIMLVSHNAWVVEENLDKLRLLNQKKTTLLNILGIEIQEISLPGFTLVFSSSLIKGFNWQKRPRSVQCDFGYGLPHDQWIIFLASTQGKIVLDSTPLVLYRQHGENKCGLPAKADLMKDLRHSRQAGCKSYLQRAEILFEWVECLNALSLSSPKIYEKNLREAAEYWQKMGSMYIRRSDIYSDKSSFVDRINPLLELLLSGRYWNKKGGLGIKALLKDAAHTVGLLKIK